MTMLLLVVCARSVSECIVFQRRLVVLGHVECDDYVLEYVYIAYAHAYSPWRFSGLAWHCRARIGSISLARVRQSAMLVA